MSMMRGLRVAGRELSGVGRRHTGQGTCEKGVWGETRVMGARGAHPWPCSCKKSRTMKLWKSTISSSSAISLDGSEGASRGKVCIKSNDSAINNADSFSADVPVPEQKGVMCAEVKNTGAAHGWAD